MNRTRILRFLDELDIPDKSAISLYISPDLATSDIDDMRKSAANIRELPPDLNELISVSHTGAVILWGSHDGCMIIPPFPIDESRTFNGCNTDQLRALLLKDLIIALLFVRLGDYAIGVFRGEKLVTSKVGTGLIHSRHKKGGSSQRRFERHREKQMEAFFDRVCGHAKEHLQPYVRQLDHVIYGGENNTLRAFRKRCEFLDSLEDRTSKTRLDVRKPRQQSLQTSITELWSSELFEWLET